MQTPKRKPGKYSNEKKDPYITKDKFSELKNKLEGLKKAQPRLCQEVKRLASDGDFSENAAYQIAKGRLRGVNQGILDLEKYLKQAIIIQSKSCNSIQLGSMVTIEITGENTVKKIKTYKILGSTETDPLNNVISHNSPLGSVLMNKKVNDILKVEIAGNKKIIKILEIS